MKISTLIAAVTAGFSCALAAQTERDLESHEHGHALLNVAIDSKMLSIELDTPWNNVVGFEHKPGNSEEQALVDNAMADLNDPQKLFDFEGAQCTLVDTMVENTASDDDHHDEDKHNEEAHHDEEHAEDKHHDEEHAEDEHHDEEHDEHKHDGEHADHGDEGETHSEVRVSYSFVCDNIDKLAAINVKFFELWAGFEELDAQLIGPSGQAAAELNSNATRLDIAQVQ